MLKLIGGILIVCLAHISHDTQKSPVKWTFELIKVDKSIYEIQAKATIEEGWFIHSAHQPKGISVMSSNMVTTQKKGYRVLDRPLERGEMWNYFSNAGSVNIYVTELTLSQPIQKRSLFTVVEGYIEYQACSTSNGKIVRCTPVDSIPYRLAIE